MNKFADNTDMYNGTLAADEIVNKLSYFTLSPNVFVDNVDSVFIINEIGQI